MMYREIIAVCSQIHTKHINTLCGQNVELLNVKLAVHIVTTVLRRVAFLSLSYSSFPVICPKGSGFQSVLFYMFLLNLHIRCAV